MQATVRQLKNQLSEYLRRVQDGEEVTVTSHGRPVARLTAVQAPSKTREEAAIERLDALPWVRPGRGGKPLGAAEPIPWSAGEKQLSDIVRENRD